MEVKTPHIPEIYVPQVYVPEVYEPSIPIHKPEIFISPVGCTYQHRDIENTGNRNLLIDDPNGVFLTCGESLFPSFYPIDYRPDQLVITENLPITNETPPMPETDIPKTETPKEKE